MIRPLDRIFIVCFVVACLAFGYATWLNLRLHTLNLELWDAHLDTQEQYGN